MVSGTSLKAYFQFEESSGNLKNKAGNVQGNATLGSAADGTNTSVTQHDSGIINFGYKYVYASNSNTVLGSSKSQFDFLHNTTALFTINFWYKFTSAPPFSDDNHAFFGDIGVSSGIGIACYITGLATTLDLRINGTTSTDYVTSAIFPADTSFHMITITYDESLGSSNLLVYLDGSLHDTINKTGTRSNSDSANVFEIGQIGYGGLYTLNANLDEFSIWNRVLSSTEITSLYNSGAGLDLTILQISDALTLVESVTKMISKSISDSISLSGEKVNKSINKTISDTLSISDLVHTNKIFQSISDSISLSGEKVNKSINKTISDTLSISDLVHTNKIFQSVSDNILTTDTVLISKTIIKSVVDNLVSGDTISKSLGKQINDSPSLSDVLGKNINKILSDNLSLVDIISKSITKLIVENPSFLDSTGQSKTLVKQITDALSLLESVVVAKQITRQIIDNLSSGDSISKNIGKLLQDNPTLVEQLSKAIAKIITDNISIPDSVTKNIGSLLLNQTRRINLNNTTQQTIAEGKPRNVTI